ncbi:MAG: D-alanyl-D-alanine carboxypeptidase, partial [Candidatus Gastranaerophilaceae bacterium]
SVEWGVGWMWDDGTNALMPKFGAYNLDGNVTNFSVSKDENGAVKITSPNNSTVLNNIKPGNENKLYAVRHDWITPDLVCISGTLSNVAAVKVPTNNLQRYFEKTLFNYLSTSNIKIANRTALFAQVPQNAKKLTEICHNASMTYNGIFKNSSNLYAENLAKIAGGVKYNSKANLADQLNVFYDFWNKKGVDTTGLIIADASGVSRNNLITVDFMTNALNKIYNDYGEDKIKSTFAKPGEGTLDSRFLNDRGSLYLKTGTLSNISGLTGYVVTEKGKTYSVAILIQNFVYPTRQIKLFENSIIENIIKM